MTKPTKPTKPTPNPPSFATPQWRSEMLVRLRSKMTKPCQTCGEPAQQLRTFPVQGASRIPWEVAEQAYIGYVKEYGSRQTLERLAQRGGFGVEEMDSFYPPWRATTQCILQLKAENERLRHQVELLLAQRDARALDGGARKSAEPLEEL